MIKINKKHKNLLSLVSLVSSFVFLPMVNAMEPNIEPAVRSVKIGEVDITLAPDVNSKGIEVIWAENLASLHHEKQAHVYKESRFCYKCGNNHEITFVKIKGMNHKIFGCRNRV